MIESSINEVDRGVIEAAQSMGAGTMTIIMHVLLVGPDTVFVRHRKGNSHRQPQKIAEQC